MCTPTNPEHPAKYIFTAPLRKVIHGCLLVSTLLLSADTAYGDTKKAPANNTTFAFQLFSKVRSGNDNVVFSPFSIEQALGMTLLGAKNETAKQLQRSLSFTQELGDPRVQALAVAMKSHTEKKELEFQLANGVWIEKQGTFLESFLNGVKEGFSARLMQADFINAAQAARLEINSWVANVTKGKILDLLAPDLVTTLTRLILVNAVYFKADWATPFNETASAKADFWEVESDKRTVTLMWKREMMQYSENSTMHLVKMLYRGGTTSMVVVLPKKRGTLEDVEKHLTESAFAELQSSSRHEDVELYLPKFKVDQKQSLVEAFRRLGATLPFDPEKADFSGIDGTTSLAISEIIHSAVVETDEHGSEAAAATAVVMADGGRRIEKEPIVFRADHPFLFFILEESTGGVLFMGRVAAP